MAEESYPLHDIELLDEEKAPSAEDKARLGELTPEISDLIHRMISKQLPVDKADLLPLMPLYLSERLVCAVLDRASGMRQTEIARKRNMSNVYLSRALAHPHAQLLLSKLLGDQAKTINDAQAKMRLVSPEIVDNLVDTFRTTEKDDTKIKIGFGILDRAGYNPTVKSDVRVQASVRIDSRKADLISQAIAEAAAIQDADYSIISGGGEGRGLDSGSNLPLLSSGGIGESNPNTVVSPIVDGMPSPSAPDSKVA